LYHRLYVEYSLTMSMMSSQSKQIAEFQRLERQRLVLEKAKQTFENKELFSSHMWRTTPCKYGVKCRDMNTCSRAHFTSEYRPPTCLYLEFCINDKCTMYHPHAQSEEEYMRKNEVSFRFPTKKDWETFSSRTRPLTVPTYSSASSASSPVDQRVCTKLCNHVTNSNMCSFPGCTFAHSVEQLVLPPYIKFSSLEEKKVVAERFLRFKIDDVFMRPAWKNNLSLNKQRLTNDVIEQQQTFLSRIEVDENEVEEDEDDDEEELKVVMPPITTASKSTLSFEDFKKKYEYVGNWADDDE
jgi:hypothetical protein